MSHTENHRMRQFIFTAILSIFESLKIISNIGQETIFYFRMGPKCTKCAKDTKNSKSIINNNENFGFQFSQYFFENKVRLIFIITRHLTNLAFTINHFLTRHRKMASLSLQPIYPPMTINLDRQLEFSSVEIQSQEKGLQNTPFTPRNLLPSGVLEGVEGDEQSGS